MSRFTESVVEEAAIEWFEELGYTYVYAPDISLGRNTPTSDSPKGEGTGTA